MNKKSVIFLSLICLMLIVSFNFISATLLIGNQSYSIEKKYGPSQNIAGWINISIKNEDSNSIIRDSFGNNITLIELLNQNPNVKYSCLPKDCKTGYSASNSSQQKGLGGQESKIYGILFSGEILSVNSIGFDISATGVSPSCSSQIEVDFFNDGIVDYSNSKVDSDVCAETKNYSCFSQNAPYELTTIETQPNCQKINLTKAPGFRIGAWIKKEGSSTKTINAAIYNKDGFSVNNGACKLPDASATGGEVFCDVNYSLTKPEEHYICIYSSSGTGTYMIKGYDSPNGCGFWGFPPANENVAYSIFATAKKFGAFSSLSVSNSLNTGDTLSYLTESYIKDRYGNLNCSGNCVVPVKFETKTGTGGNFSIVNVKIDQNKNIGNIINDKLNDVSVSPAKISSDFGKLYLDNSGLKAQNSFGKFSYALKFNSQSILSETLSVEKTPVIKGLVPLKTAYAFPTKFQLNMEFPANSSKGNISYAWDFGDNETQITATQSTMHIYNESGNYGLKITIKDQNNISSSRTFSVNVTSPAFLINTSIAKMKKDLANVKTQINSFDLFYRESLGRMIKTNEFNSRLDNLEQKYNSTDESNYNEIVAEILDLRIPEAVMTTKTTGGYVFFPGRTSINIEALKSLETKQIDGSESAYTDSIYVWNAKNIKNTLNYREISARYSEKSEPILKAFTFKIEEKNPVGYSFYFVVKDLENLSFEKDYGQKNIDGYNYIELGQGAKEITFSTTENVDFTDVPAFISPPLSRLSIEKIGEASPPEFVQQPFRWDIFLIAIAILLVMGVVAYIFLQIWYKNKYEGHLFKNKNDLYNLFHYIELQRKKRATEKEIQSKLKSAGWNSEQINFATKKYSGKRTGMFEIPIGEIWKKFMEKT